MERISIYTADLQQGDVIVRGPQGFACEVEVASIAPATRVIAGEPVHGSEVIGYTPMCERTSLLLVPQSRLRVVRP